MTLIPQSEETKRRVGSLVVVIISALWQLRSASADQAVTIVRRIRSACEQFLSSKHDVENLSDKRHVRFCLDTPLQSALKDNNIKVAFQKLEASHFRYSQPRGRGAKNVIDWTEENLIQRGVITAEELASIPVWMLSQLDARYAKAITDHYRD